MSDVRYSVEIAYFSSGSAALPGLQQAQSQAKSLESSFDKLGSMASGVAGGLGKINSMFDSLAGGAIHELTSLASTAAKVLTGAFAAASLEAIKFNEQLDNANISIATLALANGNAALGANGKGNLAGGFLNAGTAIRQMQKDARELPGEFKDLEQIMTTLSPVAMSHGFDVSGTEALSARTMSAASVLGVEFNTAAREMAHMLSGSASSRMPMFQRLLGGEFEAKEFNKLSQHDRIAAVQSALDRLSPAIDLQKHAFTGVVGNVKDTLRQGVARIGRPSYDWLRDTMEGTLNKFTPGAEGFNERLYEAAITFGEKLGTAIKNTFSKSYTELLHWGPLFETFAETMYNGFARASHAISSTLGPLMPRLEHFLSDPAAFSQLEHLVHRLIEFRAATGIAGGVAGGASGLASIGSMFAGEGALAGVGPEIALLLVPLAALGVAAWGVVTAFTDVTSEFHDVVVYQVNQIGQHTGELAASLGELSDHMKPISQLMGTLLLAQIDSFVRGVTGMANIMNWFVNTFDAKLGILQHKDEPIDIGDRDKYLREGGYTLASHGVFNALAEKEKEPPPPPVHTTHIHNVEIKVNSNQDPSRIAQRTLEQLLKVARHPLTQDSPAHRFNRPTVPGF